MEERRISVNLFNEESRKWNIWSRKFLERAGQLGCDIILRGTEKILAYNTEENNKED